MANTDPILTTESSVDRGFWNKGSLQVDGDLVLPQSENNFTNPDLREEGKLRYDSSEGIPLYYNGTEWIPFLWYVTPEMYGAIGDGITDDYTALQESINTGKMVLINQKTYYTTQTLQTGDGAFLVGSGLNSIIYTDQDISIIETNGLNSTIRDLTLKGSGKDSGLLNQNGINRNGDGVRFTARHGNMVSNVRFYDFGGSGFYCVLSQGAPVGAVGAELNFPYGGTLLINCFAIDCNNGYYADERGEYSSFANCQASGCENGAFFKGGNNNWVGGQLTGNTNNFRLGGGTNNGHCTISSAKIHHAITNNILIEDVSNGYRITNCDMGSGGIVIEDSADIIFDLCNFSFSSNGLGPYPVTITNSTGQWRNSIIRAVNPSSVTITGGDFKFIDNDWKLGVASGVTEIKTIYDSGNQTVGGVKAFSSAPNLSSLTDSTILGLDGSKNIQSLDVATYPSLVELAYLKGVTSSIQTQINGKFTTPAGTVSSFVAGNGSLRNLSTDVRAVLIGAFTLDNTAVATTDSFTIIVGKVQGQINAKASKVGTDDIEITDTTKGIILKSPDGTRYRITVANGGTLNVNAV